jgi:hypothetical protein
MSRIEVQRTSQTASVDATVGREAASQRFGTLGAVGCALREEADSRSAPALRKDPVLGASNRHGKSLGNAVIVRLVLLAKRTK